MSRITWITTALFVIAVPLFLITASVTWAFNDPGVYRRGFEKYDVSRVTGISDADLLQVSADIRSYFNSRQEPLEIRTRIFGVENELFKPKYDVSRVTGISDADLLQVSADIRSYFNSRQEPLEIRTRIFGVENELFKPKEIIHMRDVKRLVQGVYLIGAITAFYLIAAIAVGVALHRRNFARIVARRLMWGGGLTLVLILAVGLFALLGFDTLFLKFHQFSFANDLWQLDSRTDHLVMLFPQNFWFDATMWVATRIVIGALLITAVSGGYLLYLRRSTRKRSDALGQIKRAQGA